MSRRQAGVRLGRTELTTEDSELIRRIKAEERARYLERRHELAPLPPPAERSSMAEGAWQKQVLQVATTLGWWAYHPHLSKWSARGWPDLSLLHVAHQRALWLELKTDSAHLTEEQVRVIEMMRTCGLQVEVLRPWHGLERVAEVLG